MRPSYLPETSLSAKQIAGDVSDGDIWLPWRKDARGVQWFYNAASVGVIAQPAKALMPDDVIRGVPSDLSAIKSWER